MLSFKLLREALADPLLLLPNHHHHRPPATAAADDSDQQPTLPNPKSDKTLALLFVPINEVVIDTYRLASIARDIGLDLHPTPSLSHIVFSAPSAAQTTSSLITFSSSLCLQNDAVPLPFPSLSSASAAHLRAFVSLANGYFDLVAVAVERRRFADNESHWESCVMRLLCKRSGVEIETMDQFSSAMAGAGWTLFKTAPKSTGRDSGVYLYRKVEANRMRIELRRGCECRNGNGREGRVRELRLPLMDFKNVALRILQYIILMTDDVFYLS
ncbi:unnamed protein product [Rhodiola kirilowii]